MQNLDMIASAIEQIEKEIWHLVKKQLPKLKEEILASVGGSDIVKKLSELADKVKDTHNNILTVFERLNDVESLANSNSYYIDKLTSDMKKISLSLEQMTLDIDSLKYFVDENTTMLSTHTQEIETLKDNKDTIYNTLNEQFEMFKSIENSIANTNKAVLENERNIYKNLDNIETLSTTLESTRSSMTNIALTANTNSEAIVSLENSYSTLSNTLDSTRASMTAINQNVKVLSDSVDAMSSKFSTIENAFNDVKDIPSEFASLQTTVNSFQSQIDSTKSSLTAINLKVNSYSSSIETITTQNTANATRMAEIEKKLSSLTTSVNNLVSYDLLYDKDSTDANINHGFTDGIGGTDTLPFNFADYSYLRLYAVVNGVQGLIDMPLENRLRTDYTIVTSNMTCSTIAFFKVSVVPKISKVQPSYTGIYTYDTATSSFKQTFRGMDRTKSYIHRIEAYRK